jgi:NAD(P)-dependent dehydrogenase (short-subunit alcohol dehydrogenase family)
MRCVAQPRNRKEISVEQVMLVTGASRGIGAATALLAARRGYSVAVNYASNEAAAAEVVRTIEAQGGRAIDVIADVEQEAVEVAIFLLVDRRQGIL